MRRVLPLRRVESPTPCVDSANLFDPAVEGEVPPSVVHRHRAAANLCRACPYRVACFEEAVESRATGIYGGKLLVDGVRPRPGRSRDRRV